jgi:hypothetical protein
MQEQSLGDTSGLEPPTGAGIAEKPETMSQIARAKMEVRSVTPPQCEGDCERIALSAVCGNQPFGPNGESEDNTFARWTPEGSLTLAITNPALRGFFKPGQKFYVDMTPAE